MTDRASTTRTFDRTEAESILLEAARLDDARGAEQRSAVLTRSDTDALTLGEIERAAAEVGIGRIAVSKAALGVALRSATAASPRVHAVHETTGALSSDALERVADDVRTHVPSSRVRITGEGLEVELGRSNGEPGSLLVKVRSKEGVSALSVWSAAPAPAGGAWSGGTSESRTSYSRSPGAWSVMRRSAPSRRPRTRRLQRAKADATPHVKRQSAFDQMLAGASSTLFPAGSRT